MRKYNKRFGIFMLVFCVMFSIVPLVTSVSADTEDRIIPLNSHEGWSSYWGGTAFESGRGDILLGESVMGTYAFENGSVTVSSTKNENGVYWATASSPVLHDVNLDELRFLRYDATVINANDAYDIKVKNLNLDKEVSIAAPNEAIRETKIGYVEFPSEWTGTADIQVSIVPMFYGDVVNTVRVDSLILSAEAEEPEVPFDGVVDVSSYKGWCSFWENTAFKANTGDVLLSGQKLGEYAFGETGLSVKATNRTTDGVDWAAVSSPKYENVDLSQFDELVYQADASETGAKWNITVKNLTNGKEVSTGDLFGSKEGVLALPEDWTGTATLQLSVVTYLQEAKPTVVFSGLAFRETPPVEPEVPFDGTVEVSSYKGWCSFWENTVFKANTGDILLSGQKLGEYAFGDSGLSVKATDRTTDGVDWAAASSPKYENVDLDQFDELIYKATASDTGAKWNITVKNLTNEKEVSTGDLFGSKEGVLALPEDWTGTATLQLSVVTYLQETRPTVVFSGLAFRETPPVEPEDPFDGTINVSNYTGWSSYWGNTAFEGNAGDVLLSGQKLGEYVFGESGLSVKATYRTDDVDWVNVSSPVLNQVNLDEFRRLIYKVDVSAASAKWNIAVRNLTDEDEINTGDMVGAAADELQLPESWAGKADLQIAVNVYYSESSPEVIFSGLKLAPKKDEELPYTPPAINVTDFTGWSTYWNYTVPLESAAGNIELSQYGTMGTYRFSNAGLNIRAEKSIRDVFWSTVTSPLMRNVDLDKVRSLTFDVSAAATGAMWNITIRNMSKDAEEVTTGYTQGGKSGTLKIPDEWQGKADLLVSISLDYSASFDAEITVKSLDFVSASNPSTGVTGSSSPIVVALLAGTICLVIGFQKVRRKRAA